MTRFPLPVNDIVGRFVRSINLVVCLYPNSMGSYFELFERDPKSMHLMAERVLGSDNEPVFDL